MKKIYILITIMIFVFASQVFGAEINFKDIDNHWAKENIIHMVENDAVNGYVDNTFKPNNEITQIEFMKIIMKTFEIRLGDAPSFKWPDYYMYAVDNYGLAKKYNEKITRYDACEMIIKIMNLKNLETSSNKFKDLDAEHKKDVLKLVNLGIINGYEDKTFRGNNTISRAESVTIALRSKKAFEKVCGNTKYALDKNNSNLGFDAIVGSDMWRTRFEIKDNKLYFQDKGAYGVFDDKALDSKYVEDKKIINIAKALASQNGYVAIKYMPSTYFFNQLVVSYSLNSSQPESGIEYFYFVYYEDKLFDLGRDSLIPEFAEANNCYLQIIPHKMWKDFYEYKNGNIIDEEIKKKFKSVLDIEFGKESNEILETICTYHEKEGLGLLEDNFVETKQFGKIKMYMYKDYLGKAKFFFEKI